MAMTTVINQYTDEGEIFVVKPGTTTIQLRWSAEAEDSVALVIPVNALTPLATFLQEIITANGWV